MDLEYSKHQNQLVTWGHWYTFVQVLLSFFVFGIFYLLNTPKIENFWGHLYLALAFTGYFFLIHLIAYLLIGFWISFSVFSNHIARSIYTLVAITIHAYFFTDLVFFYENKQHILFNDLASFWQSNAKLYFWLTLLTICGFHIWLNRYLWRKTYGYLSSRRRNKNAIAFVIYCSLCLVLSNALYIISTNTKAMTIEHTNLPLFNPLFTEIFSSNNKTTETSTKTNFHTSDNLKYALNSTIDLNLEQPISIFYLENTLLTNLQTRDLLPFRKGNMITGKNRRLFSILYSMPAEFATIINQPPLIFTEINTKKKQSALYTWSEKKAQSLERINWSVSFQAGEQSNLLTQWQENKNKFDVNFVLIDKDLSPTEQASFLKSIKDKLILSEQIIILDKAYQSVNSNSDQAHFYYFGLKNTSLIQTDLQVIPVLLNYQSKTTQPFLFVDENKHELLIGQLNDFSVLFDNLFIHITNAETKVTFLDNFTDNPYLTLKSEHLNAILKRFSLPYQPQ